jgi:hypothetical protein
MSGTHAADGSYSRLEGNGFSANPYQCVIYSVHSSDWSAPRLVQAGLVRCNSAVIDNTCTDGHTFVERNNGSSYFCVPGYSFTNNTLYDATTYRTSATGTNFYGHINGAEINQSGFGLTDDIQAFAWGEATGDSSTCPPRTASKGHFTLWKRYDSASGWAYVTTSQPFTNSNMGQCWQPTNVTSGEFYVD